MLYIMGAMDDFEGLRGNVLYDFFAVLYHLEFVDVLILFGFVLICQDESCRLKSSEETDQTAHVAFFAV